MKPHPDEKLRQVAVELHGIMERMLGEPVPNMCITLLDDDETQIAKTTMTRRKGDEIEAEATVYG